jgi:hypothetical protein
MVTGSLRSAAVVAGGVASVRTGGVSHGRPVGLAGAGVVCHVAVAAGGDEPAVWPQGVERGGAHAGEFVVGGAVVQHVDAGDRVDGVRPARFAALGDVAEVVGDAGRVGAFLLLGHGVHAG